MDAAPAERLQQVVLETKHRRSRMPATRYARSAGKSFVETHPQRDGTADSARATARAHGNDAI